MAIILFVACVKDLLEEKPKAIAAERFYNTPDEVESGLNTMYGALQIGEGFIPLYIGQLEGYGDYIIGRGSYSAMNEYQGLDNTNITRVGDMWKTFYTVIRNANICIKKIPDGKNLTDAEKSKYMAEARYMRGLVYFCLVRNWGGCMLRTEANMDSINVVRSSSDDIYAMALADLISAEQNLPDEPRLIGTPSKFAAATVLAEMYLWLEQWQNARDKANTVIQSNKFSLVPVTIPTDFHKIYGPDIVTTSEEIFYLKYSTLRTNRLCTFANQRGDGRQISGGDYVHYSFWDNPVIANWNDNDLRKQFYWYERNIGLSSNVILNAKYSDPKGVGAGNDYPWYKYSDVLLIYAEAECRVNGGPNASAVNALNQVRRRAYGFDPTQTSSVDVQASDYNEQSYIDLVSQERCYETCGEGKRWLDLKRLGVEKQVILGALGKTVADKMLLWPIPVVETSYNKGFDPLKDQNPGY